MKNTNKLQKNKEKNHPHLINKEKQTERQFENVMERPGAPA